MADKSNFTPDEWKLLLESVMMAGIAVTAADPSGLWGMLKESFASSSELVKVRMDPGANPLIKAVVSDFGNADGRGWEVAASRGRAAHPHPAGPGNDLLTYQARASTQPARPRPAE